MSEGCYVFSDVDETLIEFKSMLEFMRYFLFKSQYAKLDSFSAKRDEFHAIIEAGKLPSNSREMLNRRFYGMFEGISQVDLNAEATAWIQSRMDSGSLFIDQTLEEIKVHQKKGAKIVLVSGSFQEILAPICVVVKADALICSKLELQSGVYTGKLIQQVIGEGKWLGIKDYLDGKICHLDKCYAYGDHHSDFCFMEKVGHPVLVSNTNELRQHAASLGWRLLDTDSHEVMS